MPQRLAPDLMALRVACELRRGQVVNLGIGLPTQVANFVTQERGVIFHTENGLLGYGPHAVEGEEDEDLINARGEFITLLPGAAAIDHTEAFGIPRSGRLDVAVLGALQVSQGGDMASWLVPEKGVGSPGGALDLAAQAGRLVVIMEHTTAGGSPKVLRECTFPLTVAGRVDLIVTDVAVMQVTSEGLFLREVAPGWSAAEVQKLTEASLLVPTALKEMDFSLAEEPTKSKVFSDPVEALADVFDGATVLMDGFGGLGGMAHYLMLALRRQGAKDLTIVSNTAGIARVSAFGTPPSPDLQVVDHSVLVETGQVRKAIASFPVSPSPSRPSAFERAYRPGLVELEILPQGTMAERLRAGAFGVPAFYTPTGVGTVVGEGKETRVFEGREYLLERAIRGDFALIRAHKADTLGNLVYRGSSRNFNAVMVMAADVTIAEVDEVVEPGELDPDAIVTPGIYVDRIVQRPRDFSPFQPVDEGV